MGRDRGIIVEGLVREFRKGPRAVDGIDLRVEPGEVYGFLGPNGAGKSTTVLMLTTLLPPSGGTARVAGYDIVKEGPQVRASIGAALQEAADRRVRGYSGGMKRRLDLALALVHEPSILFLDEPTTGLDPQSRSALWSEVSRLARDEGVTVFLTTQYLEEADVLADRVGIIDRGRIVAEDTPEALKAEIGRPSVEATPASPAERDAVVNILSRFGEEIPSQPGTVAVRLSGGASGLADVVRALDAENLKVTNLRLEEPSLDDVFLAKTGRSLEGAGDGEENEAEEAQG